MSQGKSITGKRTHAGSCHCGAVRFEVELDLSEGTTRCNCRYCTKTGWWGVLVKPEAFRVTAGAEHIERVNVSPIGHRSRCAKCGIVPFGEGDLPELGGAFRSINIRCLDGVTLEGVPVKYLDGRHDTWALLATNPWVDPWVGAGDPKNKPMWA